METKARLLREVVLQFTWDDEALPSVDVPLGDFFCNALAAREFHSFPLSVTNGAFECRFPMGFSTAARGTLRNDGPTDVSVTAEWDLEPAVRAVPYFHARWAASRVGGRPHSVVKAAGQGHYVGCYLLAHGTDGSWFMLEGDEVVQADGRDKAVWHGTGLEDYFNGAWYYSGLFTLPLHGLVEKAAMRTAQYRFHLLDSVHFDESIGVSFEFGDRNRSKGYMSSVGYWYAREPRAADSQIPALAQRFLPIDQIGAAAFMSQLFELERIGHYREAHDRCLRFAEQFGQSGPLREIILSRAEAYNEQLFGGEAVLAAYQSLASRTNSPVSGQAQTLLWFHEQSTRALFGAHANGRFKAYVDGSPVVEGADPAQFYVRGLTIAPGWHEIRAEVAAARSDTWFSATLRTHGSEIRTDHDWEYTRRRPQGWPAQEGDGGVAWVPVRSKLRMLPRIGTWVFAPNMFVGMQSGTQLLSGVWDNARQNGGNGVVYLRRRFDVLGRGEQSE